MMRHRCLLNKRNLRVIQNHRSCHPEEVETLMRNLIEVQLQQTCMFHCHHSFHIIIINKICHLDISIITQQMLKTKIVASSLNSLSMVLQLWVWIKILDKPLIVKAMQLSLASEQVQTTKTSNIQTKTIQSLQPIISKKL